MPEPALLKFLSLRIDSFVYGEGEGWTGYAGKHTSPLSFKYSISYPGRFVKGFYKNNLNIFLMAKRKIPLRGVFGEGRSLEHFSSFRAVKRPTALSACMYSLHAVTGLSPSSERKSP